MEYYDPAAIGGEIAGAIAARLVAEAGLQSSLIERAKMPRNKPCSGIQLHNSEKLVGSPIPKDKLCAYEIVDMNIITPDGRTYRGTMRVLHFWRSSFDRWLNDLAVEEGAIFQDKTRLVGFEQVAGRCKLQLQTGTEPREVFRRYLVTADGISSRVRKSYSPISICQKRPEML